MITRDPTYVIGTTRIPGLVHHIKIVQYDCEVSFIRRSSRRTTSRDSCGGSVVEGGDSMRFTPSSSRFPTRSCRSTGRAAKFLKWASPNSLVQERLIPSRTTSFTTTASRGVLSDQSTSNFEVGKNGRILDRFAVPEVDLQQRPGESLNEWRLRVNRLKKRASRSRLKAFDPNRVRLQRARENKQRRKEKRAIIERKEAREKFNTFTC